MTKSYLSCGIVFVVATGCGGQADLGGAIDAGGSPDAHLLDASVGLVDAPIGARLADASACTPPTPGAWAITAAGLSTACKTDTDCQPVYLGEDACWTAPQNLACPNAAISVTSYNATYLPRLTAINADCKSVCSDQTWKGCYAARGFCSATGACELCAVVDPSWPTCTQDGGTLDPRCPNVMPGETLCGKPCSSIGLDCSPSGSGAGPTCMASSSDGGAGYWWCGV